MAVRIEDAGFEIRDMIAWVYGSGFPKSLDVSKAIDKAAGVEREVVGSRVADDIRGGNMHAANRGERHVIDITAPATPEAQQWAGWGTALKPALEPITVARKPLGEKTVAANVLEHGTGAINVDGCRVGNEVTGWGGGANRVFAHSGNGTPQKQYVVDGDARPVSGRWPANLIHNGSDETASLLGEAARFFYCAKTNSTDRNEGCKDLPDKEWAADGAAIPERANRPFNPSKNNHPTVKPTALMRYLCRLVTPPKGIVLDPFMGSGSTGKAAVIEGFNFIGIEREESYMEIAQARINSAKTLV
jgi:site-specific DNA-methyltransferase (adenine-specific)